MNDILQTYNPMIRFSKFTPDLNNDQNNLETYKVILNSQICKERERERKGEKGGLVASEYSQTIMLPI